MNYVRTIISICILLTAKVLSADNGLLFARKPTNIMGVNRLKTEEWRIGAGVGFALYVGNQRSFTQLTIKEGPYTEFRPSYVVEVFKQRYNTLEYGVRFIQGTSQVLKSENTLGLQCNFNDVQFNAQYSLNENIALSKSPVTFNLQAGLGLIYFNAKFFTVNPRTYQEIVITAVGYNTEYDGIASRQLPAKQIAPIGNLGFNIGYRLSPIFALYWQNNLSLAATNKMSGNLFKRSMIPPDGYFYTGFLISARLELGGTRYGCPKF